MPNWGEHLAVANKLLKRIKVDENLFLFGNILPDVQSGYLVKGISNIQPSDFNHFESKVEGGQWNFYNRKQGYENFYEIYKDKLYNPMILGYLAHLMTDFSWNAIFYGERCIEKNGELVGYTDKNGKIIDGGFSKLRECKQKEFMEFQNYIYQNYEMKLPEFSIDITKNANLIEIININDEDVKKVVEYIKETKNEAKDKEYQLKIFTIYELEEQIDKTAEFIMNFLEKNGVK